MAPRTHSHCPYCGIVFAEGAAWPRTCSGCRRISYLNPLPVAVALVPVGDGLLCVRRSIPPALGEVALPGGFMEVDETWQEACARELREETGLLVDAGAVGLFGVFSLVREGMLLVFGLAPALPPEALAAFRPNDEVSECLVVREPVELAFSSHTQMMRDYFARRPGGAAPA
jgi:ADP-ribose pyrophosphatase YjhB (NUDIX family)